LRAQLAGVHPYTKTEAILFTKEKHMNQKATTWAWMVIGRGMHAAGTVTACDPRDAVSRALTSDTPVGQMVGSHFHVPAAVIDAAPGNGDLFYEVQHGDTYVAVRETTYRVDDEPRTMLELKALWDLLGDVPVFDSSDYDAEALSSVAFKDGDIEVPYLHFPAGTPREDIWHWFEAQNKRFIVGEVMMGVWPE
jgi:hypothetical protein